MPLYEIVLRFPDRDEIRLTDRNIYRTGEEVLSPDNASSSSATNHPRH